MKRTTTTASTRMDYYDYCGIPGQLPRSCEKSQRDLTARSHNNNKIRLLMVVVVVVVAVVAVVEGVLQVILRPAACVSRVTQHYCYFRVHGVRC